jgi:uncharacterized protein HemY
MILIGFESVTKENRDNYIVIVSAIRIIGIGLIMLVLLVLKKWVYLMLIEAVLMLIFMILFMKFTFDSSYYILATTANFDTLKYVLN